MTMGPIDGNLLLVGNYPPGTGYAWWLMQRHWLELAEMAAQRGVATYLAYPEKGPLPEMLREAPIEVIWHPIRTDTWQHVSRTTRLLRSLSIRNIYFTDRAYFDPAYLAYRYAGVRRIINHDHTPGDRPKIDGPIGAIKRIRNRIPGSHADHWIALSSLMRTRAIENGCIPGHRVSVVPNGIEPIQRTAGAAAHIRALFGLPSENRIVVAVGRAHTYKRLDFFLRVARQYRDGEASGPATFLFIGDGPDMPRLQKLAHELELDTPDLLFAGHRSDVRSILPGCHVALHPSRGEGFSLAILEYLSAGLPVVVPDIPSVAQAIEHGRTGLVYRDGSVKEASDCIQRLLEKKTDRDRMADAAADFVRRDHSLEETCRIFRETVAPLLWIRDE